MSQSLYIWKYFKRLILYTVYNNWNTLRICRVVSVRQHFSVLCCPCCVMLVHKKSLRVMKLLCCVMLVHKKTLRVIQSCCVMLVYKKTVRVMKLSCCVILVHKKTLKVMKLSCCVMLVHKKTFEWRWVNSNDLEYEFIRLVWSGRFQWCIIYKSESGTYPRWGN